MHIAKEALRGFLVDSGFVSEADFDGAENEAAHSGRSIPDILIGRGAISEDIFLETVQPYYGVPVVNLHRMQIDPNVLNRLPESIAKTKRVILYEFNSEERIARLAMLDPFDYAARAYVAAVLSAWVEPAFMGLSSFRYGLKLYQPMLSGDFESQLKGHAALASREADAPLTRKATSSSITTILEKILDHAVTMNASDIHFEPLPDAMLVRFRVDGVMRIVVQLPPELIAALIARVKVLANLAIDEHRIPQDGRFTFESGEGATTDIRVNIIPVLHGEKAEMRLLRSSARPLSLSNLGLGEAASRALELEIKRPHGLILVTGPTGHGKTTTLYALLQILNTPDVNITTIEDPVEYEFPRINQTQVNAKAGITFANGLRALLRQNPDIIMIGEIRDNETVEIAIHAALTGHRVLSSLHTTDAPSAIPRLIDMGAEPFLLSSTVNVVVAQRLVRRICTTCISSYPADEATNIAIKGELAARGEEHVKHLPETLYRGKGCNVCGMTGYLGQMGIFEVFPISDVVRALIVQGKDASVLRKQAIKEGMLTMFEDGLQKVELGATTIEEVLRVARE